MPGIGIAIRIGFQSIAGGLSRLLTHWFRGAAGERPIGFGAIGDD